MLNPPTAPADASNNSTAPIAQGTNTPHSADANGLKEQNKRRQRGSRKPRYEGHETQLEYRGSEGGPTPEGRRPRNNAPRRKALPQKQGGRPEDPVTESDGHVPSGRSSVVGLVEYQPKRGDKSEGRGRGQNAGRGGLLRGGGRRKQINAKLTGVETERSSEAARLPVPKRGAKADNLTNRLIDALRTPPYADCPICFNSIHPAQPIWSCSPSNYGISPSGNDSSDANGDVQCCYTPFHLKCIKSWASKSVNDMRDAFLARGESGKQGEWRCPGCQRKRFHVPSSYLCFCGSMPDPRPPRLTTPHSCGNPCSRPRPCNHACPLSCHPGPCPPCQITTQLPCHCGRQIKSFRCSELASLSPNGKAGSSSAELSCGNVCDKLLNCGKHRCRSICHAGNCEDCPTVEVARCYCGREAKPLRCGEGEEKHCCLVNEAGVIEDWDGRFTCENVCGRPFDCGIHKCKKPCHPPSTSPPPCPRSPSLITYCPCGKRPLEELEGGLRQKCTDPIATCGSTCMKKLEGCEHVCSAPCHIGPCPPCSIPLIIPCRCGSTTRAVQCHESTSASPEEILCDKPCTALRACGRHRCNRLCCPLAVLDAGAKGKGKKRQVQLPQALEYGLGEEARWHDCDLVCGRMLGCGNHRCEERDHRGACPPCLRSSFTEMICYCGSTVIEPPIPCGTRISCSYPCSRPPPPCGHPKTSHTCHEDPTACPPCPFLTTKTCTCGKKAIQNIRCAQETVSCGTACGKLLDCGFHHCDRLCHGGDCGTCTSVCGKPRKLCLPAHHGCAAPCHAPAACTEDEPCQASIILRCPCGRQQQPSLCGRSTSSPAGREVTQQLKCTNECAIAKRNARLAEALGISKEVQERDGQRPVTYSSDLISFAHANAKFCALLEKTFADFVTSEKKSQLLPHMHEARRKFVHDLAVIYRIETQMVDQEPQRSVQLIRRTDTRIPKPLLSSVVSPSNHNLGKLADLRSSPHGTPAITRPSSAASNQISSSSAAAAIIATSTNQNTGRGWTAVVAAGNQPSGTTSAWHAPSRPTPASNSNPSTRTTNGGADQNQVQSSRLVPLGNRSGVAINTGVRRTEETSVPDDWENDV